MARIAAGVAWEKNYDDGTVADAAIENVLFTLKALIGLIGNKENYLLWASRSA